MTEAKQEYYGDNLTFHAAAGEDIIFKDEDRAPVLLAREYVVSAFEDATDKSESFAQAVEVIRALDNSKPVPEYGVYAR